MDETKPKIINIPSEISDIGAYLENPKKSEFNTDSKSKSIY